MREKLRYYLQLLQERKLYFLLAVIFAFLLLLITIALSLPKKQSTTNQTSTISPSQKNQVIIQLPVVHVSPVPSGERPTDVFVSVTGPSSGTPGVTIVYSLTIGNNGPVDADEVFLTLFTPVGKEGLKYLSDTIGKETGKISGGGRIWDLKSLPVGYKQTATLTLSIAQGAKYGAVLESDLNIESLSPDIQHDNNIAILTVTVK